MSSWSPQATIKHHNKRVLSLSFLSTHQDSRNNKRTATMQALKLSLILVIVLSQVYLGQGESIKGESNIRDGVWSSYVVSKMHSRKLLVDVELNYDYTGPNTKHDPFRGRPGYGGRRNP